MRFPSHLRARLALTLATLAAPAHGGSEFKVVGYLPAWTATAATTPVKGLTHLNYAFATPEPDGTLRAIPAPEVLRGVVTRAHAGGVKVCLAVGGWNDGDDSAFEKLAASPETRARFVEQCMAAMEQYGLDGLDIDWEYPDAGQSAEHFQRLIAALAQRMKPKGKLLSIAVIASGSRGAGVKTEVFRHLDLLNIMAYDGADHGSYEQAESALRYWSARGCDPKKLMLGLPFYGRSPYLSYRDILAKDPAAARRNTLGPIRYNNPEMIARKTRLARANAGGVMIWELTQDIAGADSLLNAITTARAAPAR